MIEMSCDLARRKRSFKPSLKVLPKEGRCGLELRVRYICGRGREFLLVGRQKWHFRSKSRVARHFCLGRRWIDAATFLCVSGASKVVVLLSNVNTALTHITQHAALPRTTDTPHRRRHCHFYLYTTGV